MRLTFLRPMTTWCILLAVPVLLATISASAQSAAKWYVTYRGVTDEHGQVSELKDMHRVFVTIAKGGGQTVTSNYEPTRLAQVINNDIGRYRGLEVVKSPEDAEFAIYINVWPTRDQQAQDSRGGAEILFDVEFSVLTRGAQSTAGTSTRRLVYFSRRMKEHDDLSALRLEVGRLIDKLKRLRGEK